EAHPPGYRPRHGVHRDRRGARHGRPLSRPTGTTRPTRTTRTTSRAPGAPSGYRLPVPGRGRCGVPARPGGGDRASTRTRRPGKRRGSFTAAGPEGRARPATIADMQDVAVIIPAKDEAGRIAATVKAAHELPGADLVVVVDDGSSDGTGRVAREAGAKVVRHSRNRGKGAAMETGAEAVRLLDDGRDQPRHLLFLDADLAETARDAAPLTEPVRAGEADMTIAVF